MTTWSGHYEVALAGGHRHAGVVTVRAWTPARAMAAATQEAIDAARTATFGGLSIGALIERDTAVLEVALSLTMEDPS
jgi:hypothetical protein